MDFFGEIHKLCSKTDLETSSDLFQHKLTGAKHSLTDDALVTVEFTITGIFPLIYRTFIFNLLFGEVAFNTNDFMSKMCLVNLLTSLCESIIKKNICNVNFE